MTTTTRPDLRTRRAATVLRHMDAENNHDPAATVATFAQPRYDVAPLGEQGQAKGGEAVHDLLAGLMAGFPDWHAEPGQLQHTDDGVFVEVRMTGTHRAEWSGIPPTDRAIDVRVACLYDFEDDRLVCEHVWFDFATILRQLGLLPG